MEINEIRTNFESREELEKYIEFLRKNKDSIKLKSDYDETFKNEISNFFIRIYTLTLGSSILLSVFNDLINVSIEILGIGAVSAIIYKVVTNIKDKKSNEKSELILKQELNKLDSIYRDTDGMNASEFYIRYGSIDDTFLESIKVQIDVLENTDNDDKIAKLYALADRYYNCENKSEEKNIFIMKYLGIVDEISVADNLRLAKKKKK